MANEIEYWQKEENKLYDRVMADRRITAQNRQYIADHITLLKAKDRHPRQL